MAQVVVNNIRKDFGGFTAVKYSSFTVEDGEFFMLLGPSGCGKTTTLRMIAGLELPTSGEIYIGGEEVSQKPAAQRDIAFVFQMFALYPHLNVGKNISYPLISQGMPKAQVRKKVSEVASVLGIEDILHKPVSGLSSGNRQRVALGRAIVRDPQVFLMDEPLGALDAEFREHMSKELRSLHERMQATTIYVTHDQLEAMRMGDKIVVMNHGVVEQFGAPQAMYDWPATMFVASFIGSPAMNFLKFNGAVTPTTTTVTLSEASFKIPFQRGSAQGELALGVRPEHIKLSDSAECRGEVTVIEYLGTNQILTCNTLGGELRVRTSSRESVRVGENIGLQFDPNTLTIFECDNGRALLSELNEHVISHG